MLALALPLHPYALEADTVSDDIPKVIHTKETEPRLLAIAAPQILPQNEPPQSPVRGVSVPKAPEPTKTVYRANRPVSVSSDGNCVGTLKAAGALPNKPVTKDGFARTIPTKPVELKPGMERVIKTTESGMGHVLKVWVNEKGQAVSTVEGGHPQGVGRIVDPSVIVGEVAL